MNRDPLSLAGMKMLAFGIVACAVATGILTIVAGLVSGAMAAGGALIGCLASLMVMGLGQLILVASADLPPKRVLVLALATYLVSIGVFLLVILALRGSALNLLWVSIGAAVGAYGYLTGAIIAYQKARIPILEQVPKTDPPRDTLASNE
ncbi:MAG: hypothetical protein LBN10_07785 [Propionibacteriaceae bacterium]|jgi:hypothetical protein|nr:hypothetical protein [Propionibacteriaceae bacterium]